MNWLTMSTFCFALEEENTVLVDFLLEISIPILSAISQAVTVLPPEKRNINIFQWISWRKYRNIPCLDSFRISLQMTANPDTVEGNNDNQHNFFTLYSYKLINTNPLGIHKLNWNAYPKSPLLPFLCRTYCNTIQGKMICRWNTICSHLFSRCPYGREFVWNLWGMSLISFEVLWWGLN